MNKRLGLVQQLSRLLRHKNTTEHVGQLNSCMLDLLDVCENDQQLLQILLNLEADETFPQITKDFGVEILQKACNLNFCGTTIFLTRKCCSIEVLESSECLRKAFVNGFMEIYTFMSEFEAEQKRKSGSSRRNKPPTLHTTVKEVQTSKCEWCENDETNVYLPMELGLIRAARESNLTEVRSLINSGANMLWSCSCGLTVMSMACKQGDMETVKYLASECDFPVQHHLLPIACRTGNLELVKYLIDLGLEPDTPCNDGFLPIVEACAHENLEVLQYLIEVHNINPNSSDGQDSTPLLAACKYGHLATVKFLIEETEINPKSDIVNGKLSHSQCWSPLHLASEGGNIDVVRYLVEEIGANPNHTDEFHIKPAFVVALEKGHLEIAKYLANKGRKHSSGVDLGRVKRSDIPLMMVCTHNCLELVKYLVETGSKPNGDESFRPVHEAVENDNEEMLKYLLQMDIDLFLPDGKGDIPLIMAIKRGFLNIVRILCEHTGKRDILQGHLPVTVACANNRSDVVRYLLDVGFSADEEDENGNTALLTLLGKTYWKADINLVQLLVRKGNVDRPNNFNFTPLLRAIENRSYESVKILVKYGAVLYLDQKRSFRYPLKFFERSPVDTGYALPCAILRFLLQHNALKPYPLTARRMCLNIVSYEKPFELYKAFTKILELLLMAGYKLPTINKMTKLWPDSATSGSEDKTLLYKLVMEMENTVPTLKQVSVLAVRASIGTCLPEKLDKLHIPSELRRDLMLPELTTP